MGCRRGSRKCSKVVCGVKAVRGYRQAAKIRRAVYARIIIVEPWSLGNCARRRSVQTKNGTSVWQRTEKSRVLSSQPSGKKVWKAEWNNRWPNQACKVVPRRHRYAQKNGSGAARHATVRYAARNEQPRRHRSRQESNHQVHNNKPPRSGLNVSTYEYARVRECHRHASGIAAVGGGVVETNNVQQSVACRCSCRCPPQPGMVRGRSVTRIRPSVAAVRAGVEWQENVYAESNARQKWRR